MSRLPARRATPRRRDAPRGDTDWWEYATVMLTSRSGGLCEVGGEPLTRGNVERHHRMRRRDGGDRLANLLLICRDHHQYVTEHPEIAKRNGWIVPPSEPDPAAVPVLIRNGFWLLDDYGLKRVQP